MFAWIAAHLATLLVGLFLILLIVSVLIVIVRDRRSEKSSCGGSCQGCPMGGNCHSHTDSRKN